MEIANKKYSELPEAIRVRVSAELHKYFQEKADRILMKYNNRPAVDLYRCTVVDLKHCF